MQNEILRVAWRVPLEADTTMVHRSPEAAIRYILQSLPPRPFHKDEFDRLVSKVLEDTPSKFSPDVRRAQWELALKSEIFALAVRVSPTFHPTL